MILFFPSVRYFLFIVSAFFLFFFNSTLSLKKDIEAKDHSDFNPRLCKAATQAENREKNRYTDFLPYDRSRFKLAAPRDYINAVSKAREKEKTMIIYFLKDLYIYILSIFQKKERRKKEKREKNQRA